MGDTENSFQSKKRGALREISRDNPGLDDEEDSEQEGGSFKKASEEVLATRRIVSVRRKPKAVPATNPFAGIKLVAPTASVVTNPEAPSEKESANEKALSNNIDVTIEKGKEEEVCKEPEEVETEVETKAPEPESGAEEKSEAVAENEEDKAESEEKKEEDVTESAEKKKDESAPLNSFQQLSSSQNAFTNLSGTGFSTSTFSFGPIKTDGSGFGSVTGSLFGLKTDGASSFGLGLSNNNGSSSLFGGSGSGSSSSVAKSSEVAAMKEVEVETGEENEEAVFSADSILYEFTSTGWKERGKGEVKINVSKAEKEKARLVMRARGNYRLILNANIFPDMKFEAMDKKGLSFACFNSTSEGSGGFSTFALKFRDRSVVEDFHSAVAAHRGKAAKPAVLKTPENSPKASDE